jgi:hypothetical protein
MKKIENYELIKYSNLDALEYLKLYKKSNPRKFAFRKYLQNRVLKKLIKFKKREEQNAKPKRN